MKRFINRQTLSLLLFYSGILYLILLAGKWQGHNSPLFLVGHRVIPRRHDNTHDDGVDDMALSSGHAITDDEFERRLRFVMRFRRAGDPRDLGHGKPSNEAFYLTMDDGYLDNRDIAGPSLRKMGVKAVIFLVGELLRRPSTLPWWDAWGANNDADIPGESAVARYNRRCGEMKRGFLGLLRHASPPACAENPKHLELYLSATAAQKLHADGTYYLGSHTQSHPNLTVLSAEEISQEIENGIAATRSMPGYLPIFAFPFGVYDDRVLAALDSRKDIAMAFATGRGENTSRLTIRRVSLNTPSFPMFAAECAGVFDVLKRIRMLSATHS